jgi:outer membrane protein TolC
MDCRFKRRTDRVSRRWIVGAAAACCLGGQIQADAQTVIGATEPQLAQPAVQEARPPAELPAPIPNNAKPNVGDNASQGAVTDDQAVESLPVAIPDPEPIQAESGMIESDEREVMDPPESLTVADVIASVYRSYPSINQARQQARLANGLLVEAYGEYDTKLKASTFNEPTGFYKNYRHGIGVARQNWWGSNVSAGYRVGRGIFQPWYLERETEKGGEFKIGLMQPLLQGRAIDPQRFAVFQASLERQAADPILQQAILETARDAVIAYWGWVAAGASLQAQRNLLRLAEIRGEQFQVGVQAGQFAEIDIVLNRQLIAERRAKAFEAEQKFRATALKLSLYLRNEQGQPMQPDDEWLLPSFPVIESLPELSFSQEVIAAMQRRPEPRRLQIELRQLDLDRRLAQNQVLPRFDFVIEGSQDVGQAGSKSDDKGDFVLVVGAASEVPIQRSKARGKLQSTAAKITQTREKLRLQQDKIAVELQTALSNLNLAAQVAEQAELALVTAVDTTERYRIAFDRGLIDLIYLNLLETKQAESAVKLIEARQAWFVELAAYQAAAGLDPLDQANLVIQIPLEDPMPVVGQGDNGANPAQLEQDLQRRIGAPNQP